MGTRGTWGFRVNGNDYLVYNHFDSYPEGLGNEMIGAIVKNKDKLDVLKEKVLKLNLVKEGEKPSQEMVERYAKQFGNPNVGKQNYEDWYSLLREVQSCEIAIDAIIDGRLEHICLNKHFIMDSLFCEYGYIINFDTMELEFYEGYQKQPPKNSRYYDKDLTKEDSYYPCEMVGKEKIENLTNKTKAKDYYKEEEEEE